MSFQVKPRKKRKTLEEPEVELSCEEYEDQGNESPMHVMIKEEPEFVEQTLPKIRYICSKPRLTRVLKRNVANESHRPRVLERKMFKRSEFFKKKDECDSFGEYIAMSLRKHDERTQSMIKQAINNILFEQEMKKYNAGQYVVISTVDENPLIIGDESDK